MSATARDYLELCKPRVVMLMIITSIAGMYLASTGSVAWTTLLLGNLGIALVSGAAAAVNHVADQHIDKLMRRTHARPMPTGKINSRQSLTFALTLCVLGLLILYFFINTLTTVLAFISLLGYAIFYTYYLKHATPQNIVIGGIAGAAPPLLGWTAVSGSIGAGACLLVLIIYIWTPPHFWSLAIYRLEDYAKANVPMLPHTHSVAYTKLHILLYTILLVCVTVLPFIINMAGLIYLIGVTIANMAFLYYVLRLYCFDDRQDAIKTFRFSITYLGLVFLLLLVDHFYLIYTNTL